MGFVLRFSITASTISSHLLATVLVPLATILAPLATTSQDPPPLATAIHRPPNCERSNGPDLAERILYLIMHRTRRFLRKIRFPPARRRPTVDHSLVARGARRQWLQACLPDGHQPQCQFSP